MKKTSALLLLLVSLCYPIALNAQSIKNWSIKDCIDHAMNNNITLKRSRNAELSADVDHKEAKAAWHPSLSFSTSQSLQYRPFQENATGIVNGGVTSFASEKATQSGNYGLNASWTIWDGNRRKQNILNAKLRKESSAKATEVSELSLQEEIVQLYIQILYAQKALNFNNTLLENDRSIFERGKEMLAAGQISKSDLASLESNVAAGEYDIVNAQTQITTYLTSLKQVLELMPEEQLIIKELDISENILLSPVSDKDATYLQALSTRPEIEQLEIAERQSELAIKTAKSSYQPSVNLTAALGDNHVTGNDRSYWKQMKTNFAANVGLSLNIPILDNRTTKSNVERSRIELLNSQLELQEGKKALYNTIENYWTAAINNQQKYKAAGVSVKSAQSSYNYMQEAFSLGTKNIVDLTQSRTALLKAQNDLIQARYTTLMYMTLLDIYGGKDILL